MAGDGHSAEDRTEDPTPKRLERARASGQIPVSRDLNMLAGLGGAAMAGMTIVPVMGRDLSERAAGFIGLLATMRLEDGGYTGHLTGILRSAAVIVAAIALPAAACSIASALLQTQFYIGGTPIKFQVSRISPVAGLARILSKHNLLEFLKASGRLAILCMLAWSVLGHSPVNAIGVMKSDVGRLLPVTRDEVQRFAKPLMIALAGFAAVDVLLVRLKHAADMRMTREEVRIEMRESDGDPMLKAKIRRIQTQRSKRRMMAKVRTADVVITNPTHYAIALAYDRIGGAAPKVVAKGADFVAARIRDEAMNHGIPIMPNPPLARALYQVDLDEEIPGEHYRAVAEVIAYVWKLKSRIGAVG